MKLIIIFSVFCFLTVDRVHSINDDYAEVYQECARELNITDLEGLVKSFEWDELLVNPNDDMMCMLTCTLKKKHNYNTTTLNEGFLKAVEIAYENHFESTKFTRNDVETKINHCYTEEQEECKFVKCVEPTKFPFVDVFTYDLSVISKMILSEATKVIGRSISSSIAS